MFSDAFPLWFKRETNLKLHWRLILSTSPTLHKYFFASTSGLCDLQRNWNCVSRGGREQSPEWVPLGERHTDSEARPERNARQKEEEQSAGLPFCADTKASHIAEREPKDAGSRQGEGRWSGSAVGTASCDLSKGHVQSAGLEALTAFLQHGM